MVIVAASAILACGNDSGDNNERPIDPITPEGKTFRQAVTLPAVKADTIVVLTDLSTAISSVEGHDGWLKSEVIPYTTGSPSLRLTAADNEGDNPRSCVLTVTSASTDKVLLSVTQKNEELDTGIDDLHGVVTDQPAASNSMTLFDTD